MKIIIEAQPKEIADLVREIQDRPWIELSVNSRPPVNVLERNYSVRGDGGPGYSGCYSGGGIDYDRVSAEALSSIDRTLGSIGSLVKDFAISFGIKSECGGVLGDSAVIDSTGTESPVKAME